MLVSPEHTHLKPGTKQTFTVQALDQFGRGIQEANVEWSSTGGTVGPDGVFEAGSDEGNFIINAKAEGKTGTAGIVITRRDKAGPPIPPAGPKTMRWSGEVAPQKWSNLYMKVLTKLVSSGELKIHVEFKAPIKKARGEHQVEEIKAALRGLGLNDDIEKE